MIESLPKGGRELEENARQPVWFLFLEKLTLYMKGKYVSKETQTAVIQESKKITLKELNLHGNMLNLREKHIPQVQVISKKILQKYTIEV